MVRDANVLKEKMKLLILTTPIGLDSKNFPIKQSFNKVLEFLKFLENFRLVLKQVDPSEFAKVINKTDIIFISSNGLTSRTSYI